VNFPELPGRRDYLPLLRVLIRALFSRCIGRTGLYTALLSKKALRIASSSAFRSFIPAARNWKTGGSVKTLNFLRHMRLTSWRIWRARIIILYFNGRDSDAWHFAQFYIIGRMYKRITWGIIFRKYWKRFGMTSLSFLSMKYSGCQLFRLYSHKSIMRRLLTCAARSRHVFYPQNLTATYRRYISISKSSNINFVAITR